MGAAAEKPEKSVKNRRFLPVWARVARRRGRLLGPLWADLAEIFRGEYARVWLLTMRISLGRVEVCGSSDRKTDKKLMVFAVFSSVLRRD